MKMYAVCELLVDFLFLSELVDSKNNLLYTPTISTC